METSFSGANDAVLLAKSDRCGLGPIETCDSGPKGAVLPAKVTDECWDPRRLANLVLITLFSIHKSTGEVRDH